MTEYKLSPMMNQYLNIKEEHKNHILFFRLGDFYEMFFDDALLVSKELELTLTGKSCGLEERAPMCGVPFHSSETYINKLIEKGYSVAICEQTSDPKQSKGIVNREVIQIITPGTVMNGSMLNEKENNYLASIFVDASSNIGLSYCDSSTGELSVTKIPYENGETELQNELVKIAPKEIILNSYTNSHLNLDAVINISHSISNILDDIYYRASTVRDTILKQFDIKTLLSIGIEDEACELALGSLLLYLHDTQKSNLKHINKVKTYTIGDLMSLDKSTIRNLELTETLFDKNIHGSLLGVLDKTHTAMGSRKIKRWIKEPLNDVSKVNARLDAVEYLFENILTRNNTKEFLKKIYDFERLVSRISYGNANGKDLLALKNSCNTLPDIKVELKDTTSDLLNQLNSDISSLENVYSIIDAALVEDPPFTLREGGLIKSGYSEELDNLKNSIKDAKEWIANLENSEKERTGIKNIKVGNNKIFGYYIEVTRSYYDQIPDNYIRKQTLANCERFITSELKEMERLVLNAESKINKLEYELFINLREKLEYYIPEIQKTSIAISVVDVLISFAEVSEKNNYVKPIVNTDDIIQINRGRHPVVEHLIGNGIFVDNNTYMNQKTCSLLLITGPNMSGKSTYMRQTVLIVLMAQAGCFVPCDDAKIGFCDRIFTRIGASDNLSQGQSTFFVEMSELANILNNCTPKSLIILDEIGRGTSTYDGLSIAWATAQFLSKTNLKARTLFATHYHEMTQLDNIYDNITNLSVDVTEENSKIVFLHKIVQGSASRSYGIQVAHLAGIPNELLENAQKRLLELEDLATHKNIIDNTLLDDNIVTKNVVGNNDTSAYDETNPKLINKEVQLTMFDGISIDIYNRLKELDLMRLTPSEAFKILEELKESL